MIDTGRNQGGEGIEEARDDALMLMMPCRVTPAQLHSRRVDETLFSVWFPASSWLDRFTAYCAAKKKQGKMGYWLCLHSKEKWMKTKWIRMRSISRNQRAMCINKQPTPGREMSSLRSLRTPSLNIMTCSYLWIKLCKSTSSVSKETLMPKATAFKH